ncbi:MAG: hypothetical protein R3E76_04050 [Planctomycetota bacterium]
MADSKEWKHGTGSPMEVAVGQLRARGVGVTAKAYGFCVSIPLSEGESASGECGLASFGDELELSVKVPHAGVYWFWRPELPEIVELLVELVSKASAGGSAALIDFLESSADSRL